MRGASKAEEWVEGLEELGRKGLRVYVGYLRYLSCVEGNSLRGYTLRDIPLRYLSFALAYIKLHYLEGLYQEGYTFEVSLMCGGIYLEGFGGKGLPCARVDLG